MKKKLYGACVLMAVLPVLANQIVSDSSSLEPDIVATCLPNQAEMMGQTSSDLAPDDQTIVELVSDSQDSVELASVELDSDGDLFFDEQSEDDLVVDNSQFESESGNKADAEDQEYLIDALRAIVMTTEGTELVVQSDLERPAITGQMLTLQDRIDECAFYLDAVKQKAVSTEDQIDRYFSAIQRDNNMTLDDLKRTFEMNGLTYTQAREQLGRMQTVNTILELRVMSNVIVPRKDVLTYYEEHELVHDAVYYLQRAVIAFEDDRDAQRDRLLQAVQGGEDNGGMRWSMVFALETSEIAADKSFIQEAPLGQILFAGAGEDGFELYRVVDKIAEKRIPIDECYAQIERMLRQPLYEKLLGSYKEKLFERTTIIYL